MIDLFIFKNAVFAIEVELITFFSPWNSLTIYQYLKKKTLMKVFYDAIK